MCVPVAAASAVTGFSSLGLQVEGILRSYLFTLFHALDDLDLRYPARLVQGQLQDNRSPQTAVEQLLGILCRDKLDQFGRSDRWLGRLWRRK